MLDSRKVCQAVLPLLAQQPHPIVHVAEQGLALHAQVRLSVDELGLPVAAANEAVEEAQGGDLLALRVGEFNYFNVPLPKSLFPKEVELLL